MIKIADYDAIVKALNVASPTEINKATGISRNSIYRYKNGKGDIANMPLKDAIKLTEFIKSGKVDLGKAQHFYQAKRRSAVSIGTEVVEVNGADEQFRLFPDVCVLWQVDNYGELVDTVKNPVSGTSFIAPEDCYEAERQLHARIDFYLADEYLKEIKHYYGKSGNRI